MLTVYLLLKYKLKILTSLRWYKRKQPLRALCVSQLLSAKDNT